ncbi:prepilin-type N-terminal cleavage/methylation domain-containing protein [Alginatibacterium sediminis]|uniref:Prepilin-type N-terminal cleavage/methylation domain-containing protein n=1 Tax=Alginatibacterium sediminis TaxID=2164068 RepID=A0A420EL58_9ALTE|nr:prepilin-type N-terminal cleavage/methylation domain-containing protein [Alginatibacterium sediminis]RKF21370.1 prepilin-type N-terminal cleavage/methylation domain-containing protein [Alginatibacterium sediminis]
MRLTEPLGFSLLELIIVIIIIAVLVVAGAPRLLTGSNYASYTQQQDIIAELRRVQQLAMNNRDRCYRTTFTGTSYRSQHLDTSCSTIIVNDPIIDIDSSVQVTLLPSNAQSFDVYFDFFGRSSFNSSQDGVCQPSCIQISGVDQLAVSVSSEGYIYAP